MAGALAVLAPAVSAATPTWGSIAANKATGASGTAFNYASKEGAQEAALMGCGQAGCQVVVTIKKGCAAVYGNTQHTKLYYATASTQSAAKKKVKKAHPHAVFINDVCHNNP